MSKQCLKNSFRHHSGPLMFLVGICLLPGLTFLWLGSSVGWTFILAALVALAAFVVIGAKESYIPGYQPVAHQKQRTADFAR
jgi:hypothetical protein